MDKLKQAESDLLAAAEMFAVAQRKYRMTDSRRRTAENRVFKAAKAYADAAKASH